MGNSVPTFNQYFDENEREHKDDDLNELYGEDYIKLLSDQDKLAHARVVILINNMSKNDYSMAEIKYIKKCMQQIGKNDSQMEFAMCLSLAQLGLY